MQYMMKYTQNRLKIAANRYQESQHRPYDRKLTLSEICYSKKMPLYKRHKEALHLNYRDWEDKPSLEFMCYITKENNRHDEPYCL